MKEHFIISQEYGAGRPVLLLDTDRLGAMQRLEQINGAKHSEAKGDEAVRRFVEGQHQFVRWAGFRLDAYPQESK